MGFYWILWASPAQLHYPLSFGFMGLLSTPYFLYFHYFGPVAAHSHFSTSYTAHGLLFLSFWTPLSRFTSSRPLFLSHGPMIHYSCRLGLIGFLSICQLFSVRVVGLLLSTWASKMAINTYPHKKWGWTWFTTFCHFLRAFIYLHCICNVNLHCRHIKSGKFCTHLQTTFVTFCVSTM